MGAAGSLERYTILLLATFLIDAVLVAIVGALITTALGHTRRGILETTIAWALTVVALIAGAGIFLGLVGWLNVTDGFLFVHVAVLFGLGFWRRGDFAEARATWRELAREVHAFFSGPGLDRWLGLGLIAVFAGLVFLAAAAEPVIYDGLTYRLPRIGAWLQSGRITILPASDARLSYMPVVPDLMMSWFLSATTAEFHFVALAEAFGGVLMTVATMGLARESGLSRRAALLTGCLLFGMANVISQWTSTQTDLFTGGIMAGAFYLWFRAQRRREGSILGGVGLGIALGAKGTVFYLAPGAGLWFGWLAWRYPLRPRLWGHATMAVLLSTLFFAGLGFWRNWRAYDSIFAPPEFVRMHQRIPHSPADLSEKLSRNLLATAAQLFDPNSQPAGLRDASRMVGRALARRLPLEDHDTSESRGRRVTIEQILARNKPDADSTSFGIVPAALFLLGLLCALPQWRDPRAQWIVICAAGVGGFVVFFNAIVQWHGYGFRFYILAAPWVAVVGGWGIEQLGRAWRLVLWSVALAAGVSTTSFVLLRTHQIGWRAVMQPEHSRGYFIFQQWRAWATTLVPSAQPLTVALPMNLPLAAFYRQPDDRAVVLKPEPNETSAEAAVPADGSWLVVAANRFIGREGNVVASTWLFEGDETSPFSLCAYRRSEPGENLQPVLYRHRITRPPSGTEHDLLLKIWAASFVRLAITNPAPTVRRFVLLTPLGRSEGHVDGGRVATIGCSLPANAVNAVRIIFDPTSDSTATEPTVELARQ